MSTILGVFVAWCLVGVGAAVDEITVRSHLAWMSSPEAAARFVAVTVLLEDSAAPGTPSACRDDQPLSTFWTECYERQPCLIQQTADNFQALMNVTDFLRLLSNSCGSWLLQELSADKRQTCRGSAPPTGCRFEDSDVSLLPATYFDGPSGEASLRGIRGANSVQEDVVVGDTKRFLEAEQELTDFLRAERQRFGGHYSSQSIDGDEPEARVSGEEWVKLAHATNQTLFVRDADARMGRLRYTRHHIRQSLFKDAVDVGISLYYTPNNTKSSVPPHMDVMDVWVWQQVGSKRWSVSLPHPLFHLPSEAVPVPLSKAHYATGSKQKRSSAEVWLRPGDWLYIPRGTIHNTSTTAAPRDHAEPSLHLSIGVETDPHFTFRSFLSYTTAQPRMAPEQLPRDARRLMWVSTYDIRTWTVKQQVFVLLCVQRALMTTASRFVLAARKGASVVPPSTSPFRIICDLSGEYAAALRSSMCGRGIHQRRRWLRWFDAAFSDEVKLRGSSSWWWPAVVSAPAVEMSAVLSFMTTLPQAIRSFADKTSSDDLSSEASDWCGLLEDLVLQLLPAACSAAPDSSLCGSEHGLTCEGSGAQRLVESWKQWRNDQLQLVHEERYAFAEWTWINEQLVGF